mmetsp:Transcript_1135/g.2948  ORF Transcript_1135/g.2948 Transcript_1135/m.2948 type:complete len:413 (+) Transcript_1135:191-1429(+)
MGAASRWASLLVLLLAAAVGRRQGKPLRGGPARLGRRHRHGGGRGLRVGRGLGGCRGGLRRAGRRRAEGRRAAQRGRGGGHHRQRWFVRWRRWRGGRRRPLQSVDAVRTVVEVARPAIHDLLAVSHRPPAAVAGAGPCLPGSQNVALRALQGVLARLLLQPQVAEQPAQRGLPVAAPAARRADPDGLRDGLLHFGRRCRGRGPSGGPGGLCPAPQRGPQRAGLRLRLLREVAGLHCNVLAEELLRLLGQPTRPAVDVLADGLHLGDHLGDDGLRGLAQLLRLRPGGLRGLLGQGLRSVRQLLRLGLRGLGQAGRLGLGDLQRLLGLPPDRLQGLLRGPLGVLRVRGQRRRRDLRERAGHRVRHLARALRDLAGPLRGAPVRGVEVRGGAGGAVDPARDAADAQLLAQRVAKV